MSINTPASVRTSQNNCESPFSVLLLRAVITGLGMVLAAGFTGLIIMLVVTFYRLQTEEKATRWPLEQTLVLEQGESIAGTSLSGKYLVVHLQKAGRGDRLLMQDTSTGQLATKIHVVRENPVVTKP